MHTDTSSIFASIIIPIYNAEKWLEECIHSVLAQSDPDFELLLIDDGSKDCSSSICEKYQKRILVSGGSGSPIKVLVAPETPA